MSWPIALSVKPKTLFIITGDPRQSPRPAEAIRIAAGVGAWQKTEVNLYLRDAAVLALTEQVEALVDEESFTRYLPMMAEFGRPIYVQRGAPGLQEIGRSPLACEEIDDTKLAELTAASNYVIRF